MPRSCLLNKHSSALKADLPNSYLQQNSLNNQCPKNATSKTREKNSISYLCQQMAKELKKGPKTREELSISTNCARQRICTVLSVFKAVGLVTEEVGNTRVIRWNPKQAATLPQMSTQTSKLFSLRAQRASLEKEELELVQLLGKMQRPSQQASNHDQHPSSVPSHSPYSKPLNSPTVSPQTLLTPYYSHQTIPETRQLICQNVVPNTDSTTLAFPPRYKADGPPFQAFHGKAESSEITGHKVISLNSSGKKSHLVEGMSSEKRNHYPSPAKKQETGCFFLNDYLGRIAQAGHSFNVDSQPPSNMVNVGNLLHHPHHVYQQLYSHHPVFHNYVPTGGSNGQSHEVTLLFEDEEETHPIYSSPSGSNIYANSSSCTSEALVPASPPSGLSLYAMELPPLSVVEPTESCQQTRPLTAAEFPSFGDLSDDFLNAWTATSRNSTLLTSFH